MSQMKRHLNEKTTTYQCTTVVDTPYRGQESPGVVDNEVRNLNPKKATTHKNIPPKILKSNSDICVEPLTQIFND